MLVLADQIMRSFHKGQKRKDGEEYIVHPLRVKEILENIGIEDEEVLIAALLHDLLEDTEATDEDLFVFGDRVVETVKLLTRKESEKSRVYIRKISKDNI